MDIFDALIAALDVARSDEAIAAASESGGAVSLEIGDDGSITVNAGDASATFTPDVLAGAPEEGEADAEMEAA